MTKKLVLSSPRTLTKTNILLVAFLEGFLIMGVELIGAKITAPYYGTSFYVWTSIIGVTLFSLTLGYFIGGFVSSKVSADKSLPLITLMGGFFILIMPAASSHTLTFVLDMHILLGVVLGSLGFLFFPLMFLGMLSPVLITELNKHQGQAGKSAGIVYFTSTIAGIVAALLVGFLLLPRFEIIKNIYVFGLCILLISFFVSIFYRNKKFKFISGLFAVFCIFFMIKNYTSTTKLPPMNIKIVHQSEGLLGQIKVIDNFDNQSRTMLVNNSSQSKAHFTGRSLFPYVYYISTFLSHKPKSSDVLLAGVGGGSLIYELSLFDFNIEIVELDKRIVEIAEKYFLMPKKPFKTNIDDARHFFRKTKQHYDAIILDMSAGETMPSNVYTVEAFTDIKKILQPGGIVILHFISIANEQGLISVKSIGKTFEEAGYNVYLLNTNPSKIDPSPFIFIAVEKAPEFSEMVFSIDPDLPDVLQLNKENLLMDLDFDSGYVLKDNKPLLDVIHKPIVNRLRRENIEGIVKPLTELNVPIFN